MVSARVQPAEPLGRYLTEDTYFSRSKNAVKPKAFEPPPNLKLSVFRIDGLLPDEVWEIGQRDVVAKAPQPKTLYGVARITAAKVEAVHLSVDVDNIPPRHAAIVGWPEGDENKGRRKSIAQQLAAEAELLLRG